MSKVPAEGTTFRRIYDMLAEFPGVKCLTKEVAEELEVTTHKAGSLLAAMHKCGYIQQSGGGRGQASTRVWWVNA